MENRISAYIQTFDHKLFFKEVLDAHNIYRQLHGVPLLALEDSLCAQSMEKAKYEMSSPILGEINAPTMGENIYIINTQEPFYPLRGEDIVNEWYHQASELQENEEDLENTHNVNFTQIIWKSSELLGIGVYRNDNTIAVVCQYYPPGNIEGEFKENVLPIVNDAGQIIYSQELCLA